MAKGEQEERAFDRLIAQIAASGYIPDAVFAAGSRGELQTMNDFLGQFVGCGKPMPRQAREALGTIYRERLGIVLKRTQLDTYSKAARRVRELRRGVSTLRLGAGSVRFGGQISESHRSAPAFEGD